MCSQTDRWVQTHQITVVLEDGVQVLEQRFTGFLTLDQITDGGSVFRYGCSDLDGPETRNTGF